MSPKYKGRTEEWLDDQSKKSVARTSTSAKKVNRPNAVFLDPIESNATVTEVFHKQAKVRLDSGQEELLNFRAAAILMNSEDGPRERAPLAVGDRVKVDQSSPPGVIAGLCERKNKFTRPAPGKDGSMMHTLAVNLDCVAIVTSMSQPEFSLGMVDRFLITAARQGLSVLMIINKLDLLEEVHQRPWQMYKDLGVPIIEVSAKRGDGISELIERLSGKQVAFVGHSGVGKTSVLRALLGKQIGKIGEVNTVTGKGKHTTTSAVMYLGPSGSTIIDTPGVKDLALSEIKPHELMDFFPELFEAAKHCPEDCLHADSSDCKIHDLARFESYKRILDSLDEA